MTLPIEDDGCRGIPTLGANFYEFIPEGDMGSAEPRVLTVGQLESGKSYYILLTSPMACTGMTSTMLCEYRDTTTGRRCWSFCERVGTW